MRVVDIMAEPDPPIPGSVAPADMARNWAAIQGVVDREGPAGGGVIAVPAGRFFLASPVVVDSAGIVIRGAGPGLTTFSPWPGRQFPCFQFGWPRAYKGPGAAPGPAPADFVPLAGRLDATVTSGHGIALRRGQHLNLPWQGWSHPGGARGWGGLTAFTLELALDLGPHGLGGPANDQWGPVAALTDSKGTAVGPTVSWGNNGWTCQFRTDDGEARAFYVADPPGTGRRTGVTRIAFQADAATGEVGAVVEGRWAAVYDVGAPGFAAGGRALASDPRATWKFCGAGQSDAGQGGMTAGFGFTLLGARLSDVARYSTMILPGTDRSAFFTQDPHAIALLPLDDDPATACASRLVGTDNGPASALQSRGVGYLTTADAGNNWASVAGCGLESCTVEGASAYGHTVALGLVLDFRGKDLAIRGPIALGNHRQGSNYTSVFSGRLDLSGSLCPLFLDYAEAHLESIVTIAAIGFAGVSVSNSTLRFDTLQFVGYEDPATRWYVCGDGVLQGRAIQADNEGDTATDLEAFVRWDLAEWMPLTILDVGTVWPSSVPRGAAIVKLTGGSVPDDPAFAARGVARLPLVLCDEGGPFRAAVEAADRRWAGALEPAWTPPDPATPFLLDSTPGRRSPLTDRPLADSGTLPAAPAPAPGPAAK